MPMGNTSASCNEKGEILEKHVQYFPTLAALHEYLEQGGFVQSARVPAYWSNGLLAGTPCVFQGTYFFRFE